MFTPEQTNWKIADENVPEFFKKRIQQRKVLQKQADQERRDAICAKADSIVRSVIDVDKTNDSFI